MMTVLSGQTDRTVPSGCHGRGGSQEGPSHEWLARQAQMLCENLVKTSPSVVGEDGDDLVSTTVNANPLESG